MGLDRLATLLRGVVIGTVATEPVAGPCFWVRTKNIGVEIGVGIGSPQDCSLAAMLDWPIGKAILSEGVAIYIDAGDPLLGLAKMLIEEGARPRCGARSLLVSYVEGLLVHLLRKVIEGDMVGVGLLAGLGDARLARALVAMHDRPEQEWSADTLADEAGMSRSSFMDRFRSVVGQTPMAYLRGWRMAHAQADLTRGARVSEVARRYGYRNVDAFTRAYQGQFGQAPSLARRH